MGNSSIGRVRRFVPKRASEWVLCVALASAASVANGTVVQVDGTIIPVMDGTGCAGNLQGCLDGEEGVSPPNANAIDAIVDAATLPEVFRPNTGSVVTFKDVEEGAGYENSFGYYNVGDDVTNPANLHPIFGCGVPADAHSGEAQGYVVDAEPGDTTTIDFQNERDQNRYKGGFIGFYLMTPEQVGGGGGSPNCGDFADNGNTSYGGRIYFTERDLNNDGDFIHHLVYNSRLTTDRFYFGFEDLFRGGDNDFEDMLIQVTGLTPPCSPRAEVCDGIDNDCDGVADGETATIETGQPCDCDNDATCETGIAQQGACIPGLTVCVGATVLCRPNTSGSAESCNGIDDDCDGTVDDGIPGTGVACDGTDSDLCQDGSIECIAGDIVCDDDEAGIVEVCNGFDDDCNGLDDDNPTDVGGPCDGPDSDFCEEGIEECVGGTPVCSDNTDNDIEVCNDFDDDCDGATDNNLTDINVPCSVGAGICLRNGATECVFGALACNVTPGTPGVEVCDGSDNNCDGVVDEGFNVGGACDGVGVCGLGTFECFGGGTICSTDIGGSEDQSGVETCNGDDDDCDGRVDEGFVSNSCNDGSLCTDGATACLNGTITCVGGTPKLPEICNGQNDDCDGSTDEEPTDEGTPCGTDLGVCKSGTELCREGELVCCVEVDGELLCDGPMQGGPEVCDGLDNDCDGTVDEDPTDDGEDCGLSDPPQGECQYGTTVCLTGGTLACLGAVVPTSELCNGDDDDCDGDIDEDPIDVGTICGSAMGTCEPGTLVCTDGERVCMGATAGAPEICNGIDDDCNNIIDDDPTDIGTACGSDLGVCERGAEACIAGKLQCTGGILPGTEVCNGLDDDCNGDVDDGDLCEAGVCIDGRCSLRCDPTLEFGTCPEGQRCNEERFCVPDECFEVTCEPDEDGALTVCVEGECVPKCETVACREPNVCRPEDGACVGNNCTFLPHLCGDDELCVNSMCQRDECTGVSCDEGEFCREGTCVGSCARITCEPGTRCVDGTCEGTGCEATCDTGQICDPEAGACVTNPCSGAAPCEQGDVCDPRSGKCVDDPCQTITCPSDEEGEPQTCYLGQCLDRDDPALPSPGGTGTPGTGGGARGDGGVAAGGPDDGRDEPTGDYVNVTGGAACSVRSAGTHAGRGGESALAWLAILALGLGVRRRARVVPDACTPFATMLALVLLTGCRVDPFCLRDCPGDPAADGSGPINSGAQGPGGTVIPGGPRIDGGTPADGGAFSPDGSLIGCTKTRPLDDDCNERDDDCDGRVDEGIDLYRDLSNCGACGVTCALAGAQTTCEGGQCIALGCFNGFVDLNDDTDGVFKGETDGCEYECFVTNDSVEGCDGIDNDCDGRTDEDTDLNTDDDNCGVCGRFCEFFQAEGHCEEGSCTFDPLNDCKAGFIDQNDVQSDGCEFECAQSNNGAETCDGLDNDCDGRTDEDYDLPNSITDCGKCGRACEFQHATPHCNDGTCEFDPNTDCEEGFSDRDGIQLNGCEFDCTVTNNGVEICDGLDNDCNGVVDGVTTDSGGSCTLAPMGTAEGACTETGTVTCVNTTLLCLGAPEPTPELCDDVDNDCDGNVDEDTVDAGRVCEQPEGICSVGLTECQAGGNLACVRAVEPLASEFCNALDDDCDGTVDEDPDMVGEVCGTDTGECTAGTIECNSGTLECSSATAFGNPETCNDRDDDCDGNTDNTPIDEGGPCGTNVGACVQGTEVCTDGRLECQGGVRPAANESCNDSDDDCDGTTDEDLTRSCYDGAAGTENNLPCQGGTQTCAAGDWGPCNGQVLPEVETCNDVDDDCDGTGDESLTLDCYTGAGGTEDVGVCRGGHLVCSGGSFSGACIDEVVPSGEDCDGLDNDCDDKIDEDDSGNDTPRSEACYTGTSGTEGVGPCAAGTRTCISSNWGACTGEVVDEPHVCGDGVDNDCDGDDDATEGCLTQGPDTRIDGGSAGGAHSFDVRVAVGGSPLGRNVYVVWSDLRNGTPDLYLVRSTDGGQSFGTATNLTSAVTQAAVKPEIVVARDGSDDRVYIAYQRVTGSDVRWLYVLRSSNSGSSFSSETIVTTSDTDNFKHDVATSGDGGDVVVVWEQLHTDTLARDVYARSSDDNGNNWTSTEKISVNSGATPIAGKPRAVILDSLRRVFMWREARAPRSSFDVFATYASHAELDSGSPPAGRESQLEPDAADDQQSDAIVVAAAGDRVYVAWNDLATLTSGEADVLFSHSTDQGVTWSTGRVIDDPAVELSRSYGPTIAVDPMASGGSDDRVYLAWPDTRQGSQIYFAASSDGGDTFASPVRASQAMGDPIPDVARSPELVLVGGDQLVISYAAEDASEVTHVYAAASIDMGATWLYTDHLLDDGNVDAIEPVSAGVSSATSIAGAAVFWLDFQNDTDQENGDVHRSIVAP